MVSLEEVAQAAGVSVSTASRALTRPDMVASGTRDRVQKAARQLGYEPNQLARSLRQKGSRSLGLLVTDFNPFFALVAKGVQDAAARESYTVFLHNTDEDPDKERRALESLRGHLPAGLIVVPTPGAAERLADVRNVPVIELDRMSGRPSAHTVQVTNTEGAVDAVRHLLDLGHRRIGMIVGELDISTATERLAGYRAALDAAGVPFRPELVVPGHHHEEDGREAALRLLTLPPDERPTALFVGNNEMTVGAVLATRDLGLSIPHDLSLVGFDDSRWARTMLPAITVVAQPAYDLGFTAGEMLLSLLRRGRDHEPEARSVRLATKLVVRSSTGPAPAAPTSGGRVTNVPS